MFVLWGILSEISTTWAKRRKIMVHSDQKKKNKKKAEGHTANANVMVCELAEAASDARVVSRETAAVPKEAIRSVSDSYIRRSMSGQLRGETAEKPATDRAPRIVAKELQHSTARATVWQTSTLSANDNGAGQS